MGDLNVESSGGLLFVSEKRDLEHESLSHTPIYTHTYITHCAGFKVQPVHLGGTSEGQGLVMLHTYPDIPNAQQVRVLSLVGCVGAFVGMDVGVSSPPFLTPAN